MSWPAGIEPAAGRTPVSLAVVAPTPVSFTENWMSPYHVAKLPEPSTAQLMPAPGVDRHWASTSPNATVRPEAALPKIWSSVRLAPPRAAAGAGGGAGGGGAAAGVAEGVATWIFPPSPPVFAVLPWRGEEGGPPPPLFLRQPGCQA